MEASREASGGSGGEGAQAQSVRSHRLGGASPAAFFFFFFFAEESSGTFAEGEISQSLRSQKLGRGTSALPPAFAADEARTGAFAEGGHAQSLLFHRPSFSPFLGVGANEGALAEGEHAQSFRFQNAGPFAGALSLDFFPLAGTLPEASRGWASRNTRQATTATMHTSALPMENPSDGPCELRSLSAARGTLLERDLAGGVAWGSGFGLEGFGGVELRFGGGAGGAGGAGAGREDLPELAGEDCAEAAAFSALLGMPTARFTPLEVTRSASRRADRCALSAESPVIALPPPPPPSVRVVPLAVVALVPPPEVCG